MSSPTKAELEEHLAAAQGAARAHKKNADEAIARLDNLDPEAVCIAECVAAIDKMRKARDQARSFDYALVDHSSSRFGPNAAAMPAGRVLLHLAQRYDVPIDAVDPPQPERLDTEFVPVPSAVADAIRNGGVR